MQSQRYTNRNNQAPNQGGRKYVEIDLPPAQLSGHQWIQQGIMLICQSCKPSHSTAILGRNGMPAVDYQYIGLDENGHPKFRKVEVIQH